MLFGNRASWFVWMVSLIAALIMLREEVLRREPGDQGLPRRKRLLTGRLN